MSELDPLADRSLPAWTYNDPEFFALERERVFASSWQIVCHVSDVPKLGDWQALEFIGESIVVVRGADDVLRLQQCLPPPRLAAPRWDQRLRAKAGLSVSCLDL